MSKATESASTSAKTEKEGVQIKGKDIIYLNAPEICFPENAPLITDKRELYDILNELFQDGGEGGEWQPPADWLKVPEPEPWEAYLLIDGKRCGGMNNQLFLSFCDPSTGKSGYGKIIIDWGDGNVFAYQGIHDSSDADEKYDYLWSGVISYQRYPRPDMEQHLVKITLCESNCVICSVESTSSGSGNQIVLIAKLGENVRVKLYDSCEASVSCRCFNRRFVYMHMAALKGNPDLPGECFSGCSSLKRIEFENLLTLIPPRFCYNNTNLENLDLSGAVIIGDYAFYSTSHFVRKLYLPECVEIGDYAFWDSLMIEEIYAPKCVSVGAYAFYGCKYLSKVTFADDCIFGDNSFSGCWDLYPRPDGSTN